MTTTTQITGSVTMRVPVLRDIFNAHLLTVGTDTMLMSYSCAKLTLDDHQLVAVSTDRYRATRTTFTAQPYRDSGGAFEALISSADMKRALTMLPKPKRGIAPGTVTLHADGEISIILSEGGSMTTARGYEGQFPPNLDTVLAGYGQHETDVLTFHSDYLVALAKMPRERNEGIQVIPAGRGRPIKTSWTYLGVDYEHVLMPMREAS